MNKALAIFVLSTFLPVSPAFAGRGGLSKADVKLLNDSSAQLTGIDSGLARKVQRYADEQSGETKAKAGKKEMTREKAKTEPDDIKMLREAAAKLKSTKPELAKGLEGFAAREEREVSR